MVREGPVEAAGRSRVRGPRDLQVTNLRLRPTQSPAPTGPETERE